VRNSVSLLGEPPVTGQTQSPACIRERLSRKSWKIPLCPYLIRFFDRVQIRRHSSFIVIGACPPCAELSPAKSPLGPQNYSGVIVLCNDLQKHRKKSFRQMANFIFDSLLYRGCDAAVLGAAVNRSLHVRSSEFKVQSSKSAWCFGPSSPLENSWSLFSVTEVEPPSYRSRQAVVGNSQSPPVTIGRR
jgi:hypothetical protein